MVLQGTQLQKIKESIPNLRSGQQKKKCPNCQHTRSSNKSDRPLSVKVDSKGVQFCCHHCEIEGGWMHNDDIFSTPRQVAGMKFHTPNETPRQVSMPEATDASKAAVKEYLTERGIDADVVDRYTVSGKFSFNGTRTHAVGFPYDVHDGEPTAIKWRSADSNKRFSQQNKCRDFFLLETHKEGNDVLICEGEIDALAWLSVKDNGGDGLNPSPLENVTILSIPSGAPSTVKDGKIDPKEDRKFSYIHRAYDKDILTTGKGQRVYFSLDTDGPGQALATELARRIIDSTNIWIIDLNGYKDAAEAIEEHGADYLEGKFIDAEPMPVMGLHTTEDFANQFVDLYENGHMRGAPTGVGPLDELITVVPGMLTVVTGFPGCGKSDLVDQIAVNMARDLGYKTVYCSFEKPVELHMAQLSEKIVGKPFFQSDDPFMPARMTPEERDYAMGWINDHFMFMDYRKGGPTTAEGILQMASVAVMRMGCRLLVIDPYNYITVDKGDALETDVINDMLTKTQQWAKLHDCHVIFIAHPTKSPDKSGNYVCGGNDIAKSASWYAKADVGLTVVRRPGSEHNEAHVWKVRWSWMGKMGWVPLTFDRTCSRWGGEPADDDFDWDDWDQGGDS